MAAGDPTIIEAALAGLSRFGTLVILAGLASPPRLVALVASGALKLDQITSKVFPLAQIEQALAASTATGPVFEQVIVHP